MTTVRATAQAARCHSGPRRAATTAPKIKERYLQLCLMKTTGWAKNLGLLTPTVDSQLKISLIFIGLNAFFISALPTVVVEEKAGAIEAHSAAEDPVPSTGIEHVKWVSLLGEIRMMEGSSGTKSR